MTEAAFLYTPAEVLALASQNMPLMAELGLDLTYEGADACVSMAYSDRFVRPGNVISGPTLMALGDAAVWLAILGRLGPDGVMAVTSDLNVSFLRALKGCDLVARVRLLKFGRRLIHGDVMIAAKDSPERVGCHITATYARP